MYTESWEDYYDFSTTPPTPRKRKEIILGPESMLTTDQVVKKYQEIFKEDTQKKNKHE